MSIVVEHLTHTYSAGTPFAVEALSDVSFTVEDGSFVGIIGHTGSGKSTLAQHLNGLIPVERGKVTVDGTALAGKYDKKAIRTRVGMVFQYPEQQLFEETVEQDIAFGPKNMGLGEAEQKERVKWAMALMDLDYETFAARSPFDLSGGQKRRAAIAGVLAMQPRYLVLDEPAAGLDPEGRRMLLERIRRLHRETGMGVVMVSHAMDDIAQCAQKVLVMHSGRLVNSGTPQQVFADSAFLQSIGLGVPTMATLRERLCDRGLEVDFAATPKEMAQHIAQALRARGDAHV